MVLRSSSVLRIHVRVGGSAALIAHDMAGYLRLRTVPYVPVQSRARQMSFILNMNLWMELRICSLVYKQDVSSGGRTNDKHSACGYPTALCGTIIADHCSFPNSDSPANITIHSLQVGRSRGFRNRTNHCSVASFDSLGLRRRSEQTKRSLHEINHHASCQWIIG